MIRPDPRLFTKDDRPAKTEASTDEQWPLWIPKAEALTIKQALHVFREDYALSDDTLRRLIASHGIATRSLTRNNWRVSAPALAMALAGDEVALALLQRDDRSDPRVLRYFKRLGIPLP